MIAEGRIFTEGLPAERAAKPEIRRAYLGLYAERDPVILKFAIAICTTDFRRFIARARARL